MVQVRKARLTLDPDSRKEILDAGGTPALLGIILNNSIEPDPPKIVQPPKPVLPSPEEIAQKYALLLGNAKKQLQASEYRNATELGEDAKKLDRSKPDAFAFVGYVCLYARDHIPTARIEYSDAIDRGGTVEFHVLHSDGVSKITRRHKTCKGRLWVSKDSVKFDADGGGVHGFQWRETQLKEIDRGGLGPLGGGVVLTIMQPDGKSAKETFFSDRDHDKRAEEDLIVDLIKK
jgi:hypothetical protein